MRPRAKIAILTYRYNRPFYFLIEGYRIYGLSKLLLPIVAWCPSLRSNAQQTLRSLLVSRTEPIRLYFDDTMVLRILAIPANLIVLSGSEYYDKHLQIMKMTSLILLKYKQCPLLYLRLDANYGL